MRRRRAWLLVALAGVVGCGGEPEMPDTSKTVPVVPEWYEHRDLDAWMGVTQDAPSEERVAQAFALASLEKDPIRAAPTLLRLLQDEDPSVQLAAVIAAGRLAPPSPRLATVLVGLLGSPREPLRRHARQALGAMGATAVPALGEALADERLRVRWGASSALAGIGQAGEGLAPRIDALARDADDETERRQARFTLARLGADGARRCAAYLAHEDPVVRREAERALAHSGPHGVRALLAVIQDGAEVPAALAASVTQEIVLRGALGPHQDETVRVLVAALDREGPVRFAAADALTAIGAPAHAALRARRASADEHLRSTIDMILDDA